MLSPVLLRVLEKIMFATNAQIQYAFFYLQRHTWLALLKYQMIFQRDFYKRMVNVTDKGLTLTNAI